MLRHLTLNHSFGLDGVTMAAPEGMHRGSGVMLDTALCSPWKVAQSMEPFGGQGIRVRMIIYLWPLCLDSCARHHAELAAHRTYACDITVNVVISSCAVMSNDNVLTSPPFVCCDGLNTSEQHPQFRNAVWAAERSKAPYFELKQRRLGQSLCGSSLVCDEKVARSSRVLDVSFPSSQPLFPCVQCAHKECRLKC